MITITAMIHLTPDPCWNVRMPQDSKELVRSRARLGRIDRRVHHLMVTCPEPCCKGYGWYWDDERGNFFPCMQCNGLGRIPLLHEQGNQVS